MANKVHVRKGDKVYVLTGKDQGKKGKILGVIPEKSQVIVEGINIATKHKKPRGRYQQGGIIHQEAPIHSSNVMLLCSACGEPTKVGNKVQEGGQKVRVCKHCGDIINIQKEAKESKEVEDSKQVEENEEEKKDDEQAE